MSLSMKAQEPDELTKISDITTIEKKTRLVQKKPAPKPEVQPKAQHSGDVPLLFQAIFNKMGERGENSILDGSLRNSDAQKSMPAPSDAGLEDSRLDSSEISIKDIIFEDGNLEIFEDNLSNDQDELLESLENKSMPKINRPVHDVIEPESQKVFPRGSTNGVQEFYEVIHPRMFPEHQDGQNLVLLKASSLFNNSVYFQSEELEVSCKTTQTPNTVTLTLTFKPMQSDLILSTQLPPELPIYTKTQIRNVLLRAEISQEFTVERPRQDALKLMPPLFIQVSGQELILPLSFTINKFFQAKALTLNQVLGLLNHSRELHSCNIVLNEGIISSFFQLRDIFPEIVILAQNNYFLMLEGISEHCLVQFKMGREQDLGIIIHGQEDHPEFVEIVKWLFWVFGV